MMHRLCWLLPFVLMLAGCEGISKDETSPEEKQAALRLSDPLREKASQAQTHYQHALYDILTSEAPKLQDVFRIHRDLQIAMIHRGDMRYEHLWKNTPSRLKTTTGSVGWLNFDWTDTDERELMTTSPAYARLQARITVIQQNNQGHPLWAEARQVFRKMHKDIRMTTIHGTLQKVLAEIDEALQSR